jgi:YidC/Oxa1 family membrane protein insertase
MNADKNTIIGMVLLAILFFGYFYFTNQQQQTIIADKKRQEDSITKIKLAEEKLKATAIAAIDSLKKDSVAKLNIPAGSFSTAALGNEQLSTIENDFIAVTFTNKGAVVKQVQLKKYPQAVSKKPIVLGNNKADVLGYSINTGNNQSAATNNLFFSTGTIEKQPNGAQKITFSLQDNSGQTVQHIYTLQPNTYAIDWNINIVGADKILSGSNINLQWVQQTNQVESTSIYERQMSNIAFSEDNSFDYISSKTDHSFEKPAQWISVVQQFFNIALITKGNSFKTGKIEWQRSTDEDTTNRLAVCTTTVQLPTTGNTINMPLQLYYGPNDYKILQQQAKGMDEIVNLGRDVYSFVRPINKYIIMPVFNFLTGFVSNFGWAILLLTFFIRLITAPLMYGSYVSGAKMKLLRPELDELKKKFGDDQQGFAMEQMKVFREAGVNPLGGCIPALLQIPIFFALYSFFNSNIDLRGESFLWAADLSSYDVIAKLPFYVPLGFGDHISLFTITAVLTSFAISLYNMNSATTQDNPALKYMPYIFPFLMLFFFNRLPSALTWYYTVSNTVTLIIQFVIQKYIIDHDKITAKMQEARSKPKAKSKSKWQQKYEEMLESQKKIQQLKNKK